MRPYILVIFIFSLIPIQRSSGVDYPKSSELGPAGKPLFVINLRENLNAATSSEEVLQIIRQTPGSSQWLKQQSSKDFLKLTSLAIETIFSDKGENNFGNELIAKEEFRKHRRLFFGLEPIAAEKILIARFFPQEDISLLSENPTFQKADGKMAVLAGFNLIFPVAAFTSIGAWLALSLIKNPGTPYFQHMAGGLLSTIPLTFIYMLMKLRAESAIKEKIRNETGVNVDEDYIRAVHALVYSCTKNATAKTPQGNTSVANGEAQR